MNFYTQIERGKKAELYHKVLRIMRLIIVLMITGLLQVNANSFAQKITLSKKNVSLKQLLKEIRKQSNLNVLCDSRIFEQIKSKDITVKDIDVRNVLDQFFADQAVTYTINKNVVVINRIPFDPNAWQKSAFVLIKGRIIDETGKGIPGASITVKGTATVSQTDSLGRFSINASPSQTLVISFIGYQTTEFQVGNQTTIEVILKEQIKSLDDVVVIGYGSQKRKDVTGAVSSIKSTDLNLGTSSNFLQAIQGKATGIQVMQTTGQPGAGVSIKIRSNPSNADPGALFVIDGVVVNNNPGTPGGAKYGGGGVSQSPLNFINPNDIESIEILKDASSRAIYGAQAGSGVVLVTTKRGKTGKPTVQYTGSYATQKVDKMYDVLGTRDYMEQRNLINQETWMFKNKIAPYYGTVDINSVTTPYKPFYTQQEIDNTPVQSNAMDAITQGGYTQQHNLSVSSSNGKTSYFISGNYYDQKGVIMGTDYKRWNGKVNLDQSLSDKVKVGINLIGSNGSSKNAVTGGTFENGGIITAALYYPANLPLRLPDGSYPLNPSYTNTPNPLSFTTITDEIINQRLLASAYGSWEIIKDLTAKANFSYDQATAKRNNYLPSTFSYGAQVNGIASLTNNYSNTKQFDYTLNYKVPLSEAQSLDVLAGYTYQLQNNGGMFASNQNFTSDAISYYNLGAGQADKPGVSSSQSQISYASYFARAIYQLNNKYTLQASIRRDGSSKFATNHKWGYFPAISGGWILSNEKFLQENKIVDFLKLRVGYGEIGNANFPASAFEVYGLGTSPNFGTNTTVTGIYLSQAANPDLKWETAGELNVGVDFGLFGSRVTGSVDYFNKTIRDLISYIPFPADFIVGGVYGNSGKTKSTGYEIGLQSKNIAAKENGSFSWSSNINFSHYLSYWTERSPQSLATLAKYISPSGKDALFNFVYGYQSTGSIFKGQFGSAPATMPGMLPGGIIVNDIHGYDANGNLTGPDGKITAADQTLIGNLDPKFNIGFGNTFSFKNFDLNIYFAGVVQKAWSPYVGSYRIAALDANLGTFGWNTMPVSLERWTFKNPGNSFPSGVSDPVYSGYQGNSNYYFIDASYLRCQNIALGYMIPTSVLSKQRTISSLRISVDLQNAFVITKYPGLDPQVSQGNFYPLSRSIVFGLNATF